ncbi:lateral signaling target protein 2 homolog [Oppia nitens]|uniref:lateral signaling target protein 2 homolog n=1 Tax=Oppia nitens TaxID=1686743 RepID=UPI0023D9B647|nr:lateral signaling target protein 2 homolog [Oppia nitens]
MLSIRNWFVSRMLSQTSGVQRMCHLNSTIVDFYYADQQLNHIAQQLDSFDGRKDPIRCTHLVNQLRTAQDKVITYIFKLMDEWHCVRTPRDYRCKFPDDLLTGEGAESLNGQIWFGAECLAAGSNIMNHESESALLRPMAKSLTTALDQLRLDLRHCCDDLDERGNISYGMVVKLEQFDQLFATFEYEYVKSMLPIKSADEIEKQQEVIVLFSETLRSALQRRLISQDDIDDCQPKAMIAIPRLAIVNGLLIGNGSAICKKSKDQLSNLFKPFHNLLLKIRDLLLVLRRIEIDVLEKLLINEENLISNNCDEISLQNITIQRKRSNSVPENRTQHVFLNINNKAKSISTLSLTTCIKSRSNKQTIDNFEDNLSVTSVESTTTTTTSEDSFEIALAIDAKNSQYIPTQTRLLLHKLFVTISGIADQLQSNYASDLRNILRNVFDLNRSPDEDDISVEEAVEAKEYLKLTDINNSDETTLQTLNSNDELNGHISRSTTFTNENSLMSQLSDDYSPQTESIISDDMTQTTPQLGEESQQYLLPPIWVPDELVSVCTQCCSQFTIIRRRHHCRNCGQIYCHNCSNNFTPLLRYGYVKPVRVCDRCHQQMSVQIPTQT